MNRLQILYLRRLHGLTEAQAHALAVLIWGGGNMTDARDLTRALGGRTLLVRFSETIEKAQAPGAT